MKVWIVRQGFDYQDFNIDSVHLTSEKAYLRRQELQEAGYHDWYDVVEYEVAP
jgi:hypothetical protein